MGATEGGRRAGGSAAIGSAANGEQGSRGRAKTAPTEPSVSPCASLIDFLPDAYGAFRKVASVDELSACE